MKFRGFVSAMIDVAASLAAIALVLGACIASQRVSMDFRAIFAITCGAFFLAGYARAVSEAQNRTWRVIRLSVGGLVGIAALIVNNGFHRLPVLIGLMAGTVMSSATGMMVRRAQVRERAVALRFAGGWAIAVAISTLAVLPGLSSYSAFDNGNSRNPIRPFTLTVDNQVVSSADLRGHVTVLAFWASWCIACYDELPHVQNVYAKFRDDPEVIFYLVDTGWIDETPEKGRRALRRHRLSAPMAFDSGEAAQILGVDGLPAVVIMDASGTLHARHFGYDQSENMEQGLERQIRSALGH